MTERQTINLIATFLALSFPTVQGTVEEELPAYEPVSGVFGNLNSVGSDSLNILMTLWAESFRAFYPNVHIQIEGKGSSTAPPALIEGTAQIGPMSREMKSLEIDAFEYAFGYKPTQVSVSIDALAVFAHKDNPIEGLTMQQVDSIFSNTFKAGSTPIDRWGQVNLKGRWEDRSISLYGRNSASGTYGFFKQVALKKGDYRASVKEQPGSSTVVQGVAVDLYGLGYSGIGHKTSGVKVLTLGENGDSLVKPSLENCLSGDYPLARLHYIYINKRPSESIDALSYEFLRFVLSRQGQEIVVEAGYFPLPASVASKTFASLQ